MGHLDDTDGDNDGVGNEGLLARLDETGVRSYRAVPSGECCLVYVPGDEG